MSKHPVCSKCDIEFDVDDLIYPIGDEMYCEECYKDWAKEYIDESPEDTAALFCVFPYRMIGKGTNLHGGQA